MKAFAKCIFFLISLYVVTDLSYRYFNTGTFSGKGFSSEEIEKVKEKIKSQVESKEEKKVLRVAVAKVSPMKLEGFIQVKLSSGSTYTQECEVIKGEDLRVTWRCKTEG